MFTYTVSEADATELSALVGVPLVSTRFLKPGVDRTRYFAEASACESHLFLDPDTGIKLKPSRNGRAHAYLLGPELVEIALGRRQQLTIVFDQCFARGRAHEDLSHKLHFLATNSTQGLVYLSHACFVLASCDHALLSKARNLLEKDAHLPATRFLDQDSPAVS